MARARAIVAGKALIDELTSVACSATGCDPAEILRIVRPIARYLDREYGGQVLYKHTEKREINMDDIRRDLAMKIPKRVICKLHSISPYKLYLLLALDRGER